MKKLFLSGLMAGCSLFIFHFLFFIRPVLASSLSNQAALEQNELSIVKAVANRYVNINPFPDYTVARSGGLNDYYRVVCSQVVIGSISKLAGGQALSANSPEVGLMMANFNRDFSQIASPNSNPWFWLASAPGFDCLIALNLNRDVLPLEARNAALGQIKILADNVTNTQTLSSFQTSQAGNAGNSQAEEVGMTASFLNAAANLFPDRLSGADISVNKANWRSRARELTAYSYSQCSANCPFKTGKWLIANHQRDPEPIYTQSLLTNYGEMAAIYNQLNLNLPTDIFTPALSSAVTNMNTALSSYLDGNFRLKGPFNFVNSGGAVTGSGDYRQMKDTIVPYDTSALSSSIPVSNVDAFTQMRLSDGTLKSYVFKGNKIWHYICQNGSCFAQYVNSLSDAIASINNRNNWPIALPAGNFDAFSQFNLPDNSIKNFYFQGDRVWYATCTLGVGCNAQFTKTLSEIFSAFTNQSVWPVPIPASSLNTVHQFYQPSTGKVKGYVTKGDRIWGFVCDTRGLAGLCSALNTDTIAHAFSPYVWDVPLPADNLDGFSAYYQPDGTLKAYILKGDRIWHYLCNPSGACGPVYTLKLVDAWHVISDQFKWPMDSTGAFYQFSGVGDWGFDATFQNSAYAAMAVINPALTSRYENLQNEEIARGYNLHPPFPTKIVNGQWTNEPLDRIYPPSNQSATFYPPLTDGWYFKNTSDGLRPAIGSSAWPTITDRINAHWWINILDGFNSSMAYLLVTNNHYLGKFEVPGDLNGDGQVNIADLQALLSIFSDIFRYNLIIANYGK